MISIGEAIPFALASLLAGSGHSPEKAWTWDEALAAIRVVETGGEPNEGRGATGDGGNAIGPYQIWKPYHTDAAERDKSLTRYHSCLNSKAYSERVVRAYMRRYAFDEALALLEGGGTLAHIETIARIHNGGPRGNRKDATLGYWRKVRAELLRRRNQ